jgi:hypothetical protein
MRAVENAPIAENPALTVTEKEVDRTPVASDGDREMGAAAGDGARAVVKWPP